MKLYRNFMMAGVFALGLAACGDDLTITDPGTPPPSETPNIISFSVNPTTVTMAPGAFTQAAANLVTKTGVTGSVSWASSNAAVATVDAATGLITAVSEGATVVTATATAGGQTATAAIGVTIRPIDPAQVSIQSVTTGANDVPVTLTNVQGQIEINMNFDPGEQDVEQITVYIGNHKHEIVQTARLLNRANRLRPLARSAFRSTPPTSSRTRPPAWLTSTSRMVLPPSRPQSRSATAVSRLPPTPSRSS